MKNHIIKIFSILFTCVCLLSCEKEEDRVVFQGGTAPVLVSSTTTDVVLTKAKENFSSLQFQWTNPDYGFSNGTNTQDVIYTLEIDTAGANFTNPKHVSLTFTRDLSTAFTVKQLNNTLSSMELKDFMPHNFEFRIRAALPGGTVPVYSNVLPIKITTYLDVVYPVPAKLYITGAATPKSWMAGGDPPDPSQEFTKINPYTFQLNSLVLNASSGFLFVPVYGNWSNKYGFTGAGEQNNPTGDSFRPEGNDFRSPAQSRAYKITVNFKTGRYSLE
jgi:starch-binding outer membrane protein SusE/F